MTSGAHHDPRVDVAERAETEQIGAVLAVVEGVRGCCVDRHRAAVGGGIRLLAGVDLQGLELELSHGDGRVGVFFSAAVDVRDEMESSDPIVGGNPKRLIIR